MRTFRAGLWTRTPAQIKPSAMVPLEGGGGVCEMWPMANATDMTRGELESLLRFYAESGLDFPLADDKDTYLDGVILDLDYWALMPR